MTDKYHNVDISFPAADYGGSVTIDGVRMLGVTDVSLDSPLKGPTKVTVTFIANVNWPKA